MGLGLGLGLGLSKPCARKIGESAPSCTHLVRARARPRARFWKRGRARVWVPTVCRAPLQRARRSHLVRVRIRVTVS